MAENTEQRLFTFYVPENTSVIALSEQEMLKKIANKCIIYDEKSTR